jgi:hypothetical protein
MLTHIGNYSLSECRVLKVYYILGIDEVMPLTLLLRNPHLVGLAAKAKSNS